MCFSKKTDDPIPWCYAAVRPPGFFFREKKLSGNLIMRIYEKKVDLCVFLRKLIKYAPPFPPHPTTLVPPKPISILNQAGPAQMPARVNGALAGPAWFWLGPESTKR